MYLHKILHCHPRRTEPQPQVTCTENVTKDGRVEICKQADRLLDKQINKLTDRHTDSLIAILCTPTRGEVKNETNCLY